MRPNAYDVVAEAVTVGHFYITTKYSNVLCPDGVRRTVRVTREPDTFFTHPGRVSVKGKTVTGFVTGMDRADDRKDMVFVPQGKNSEAVFRSRTIYLACISDDATMILFDAPGANPKVGEAFALKDGRVAYITKVYGKCDDHPNTGKVLSCRQRIEVDIPSTQPGERAFTGDFWLDWCGVK
jgi:hypothetical protein